MKHRIRQCTLRGSLLLASLSLAGNASAVGTRRFELQRGDDFEGGDLKGVAIDGAGRVHAGLNLADKPLSAAATVWSALERSDGSVLIGTGNEGKLLEFKGDKVQVLAESGKMALTSLVPAWGGDILVASLPGGQIFRWAGGKLAPFAKLDGVEHVWQLDFDSKAQVLYAATGPEGRLFRIEQSGKSSVYFDAEEQHLVSVLASRAKPGRVYAGASDRAKLYAIGRAGSASVVHDFGVTEVRAIAENPQGDLFAIANEIEPGTRTSSNGDSKAKPPKGKGVLYRFAPDGTPEQLLSSKKEHFVGLAIGSDGRAYVGTGVEGRIYTADESHHQILMADTEERQVAVLAFGAKRPYILSSDPAVMHRIVGLGGPGATWTSRALDAGLKAYFGRLSWLASGPLELSTRSGNSKTPDATWSGWSPALSSPGRTGSPPGRYVQVRAQWQGDPSATLSEVSLRFVTDNLRALLTRVEVERPEGQSVTDGDDALGPSGGPIEEAADPQIKLKWSVDNPDSDELRYQLQYRMLGTETWFDVLPPDRQLTKRTFAWDTSDLPEGRYQLRVEASDDLSNPPDRAKRHRLESGPFTIDNTPPTLMDISVTDRHLRATAIDGVGPIARLEVGIAGRRAWYPFYPRDGIFDEQREEFDLDLSSVVPAGPQMLNIRVFDEANNFFVKRILSR